MRAPPSLPAIAFWVRRLTPSHTPADVRRLPDQARHDRGSFRSDRSSAFQLYQPGRSRRPPRRSARSAYPSLGRRSQSDLLLRISRHVRRRDSHRRQVATLAPQHAPQDSRTRCASSVLFSKGHSVAHESPPGRAAKERQEPAAVEATPRQCDDPDATPKRRKALTRNDSMDFLPDVQVAASIARCVPACPHPSAHCRRLT